MNGLLDQPFAITRFDNFAAKTKREECFSLRSLGQKIETVTAPEKGLLPWLKCARFGEVRTENGSLRHNANVLAITGIEADYDGGRVTVEEAVETLEKAGILALVYTSPSHTDDAPRWRVLCPLSSELPPDQRHHLMGRLNGLFRGILAPESWTLSQSYYFGSVRSNPSHTVVLVDGAPIDEADELDAMWLGKQAQPDSPAPASPAARPPMDEVAVLEALITGANYHVATVQLAGLWARQGVPYLEARQRLQAAFDAVPAAARDPRWTNRTGDIDRCLKDIYRREARATDEGRRPVPHTPAPEREVAEPWPEPVDFLADAELTGAPELRPEHLPEALYGFVADTAGRMGVDPASVALAAVVACASVASDRWQIQPKQHDDSWTENPRLWGAIVGDPSILKTPVISACTKPLDRLDAEARRRYGEALRRHQQDVAAWKAAGSDPSATPKAPVLDRYLVEGTTIEALSEALRDDFEAKQRAPSGKILVRQDEMSEWVASFDRYRSGGRGGADRGAYLRLFNGGRYTVDRIGRGSFAVPNWSACVLGGIQPEPIQRIAREAADDGLLQRFLYCVPGQQSEGEDRTPDRQALARYQALFPALAILDPPAAPFARAMSEERASQPVVLHAEAHAHRLDVDGIAQAIAGMPDTSTRLKAALGKWRGLFARLALTFHLIDIVDAKLRQELAPSMTVLPAATAERAARYLREVLLPHLLRAEALMFSTSQTGHARWIAGFILAKGQPRIALRDVVQAYGPLRAPESRRELLEVMESLVTIGWLRPEAQSNLTRAPSAWEVNPAVHSTFVERAQRERAQRRQTQAQIAETVARIRRVGR